MHLSHGHVGIPVCNRIRYFVPEVAGFLCLPPWFGLRFTLNCQVRHPKPVPWGHSPPSVLPGENGRHCSILQPLVRGGGPTIPRRRSAKLPSDQTKQNKQVTWYFVTPSVSLKPKELDSDQWKSVLYVQNIFRELRKRPSPEVAPREIPIARDGN
jgi:hypothetical protein